MIAPAKLAWAEGGEGDARLTRIVSQGKLQLDSPGFGIEAQPPFPEPYEP